MTNCCRWTYKHGRSFCPDCGGWALDLRCFSHLRQSFPEVGVYDKFPTATDVQNVYACAKCLENFRARVIDGELRIVCENGHDLATTQIIAKATRDYRIAQQEADADEVLEGLPAHLRALIN